MRAVLVLTLILAPVLAACAACAGGAGDAAGGLRNSTNLIDLLATLPEHSTFVHLLQRTRLIPTLNRIQELDERNRGMTLLAPTNDAFRAAQERDPSSLWGQALDVLQGPERPRTAGRQLTFGAGPAPEHDNVQAQLRQQLLYHVLNYTLPPTRPDQDGSEPPPEWHETLHLPSRRLLHEPTRPGPIPHPPSHPPHPGAEDRGGLLGGAGQVVRMAWRSGRMRDASLYVGVDARGEGGVHCLASNRSSPRGVILSLDGVLDVPPSLDQILHRATNSTISSVFQLLPKHMQHTLATTAHLTMFLPSEAAMRALSPLELAYLQGPWPQAAEDRLKLFAWHASSLGTGNGRVAYASHLRRAAPVNVTAVLGGRLQVAVDDGALTVNGAPVVSEDLLTENGVVHVLDGMHLPFGDLGMTVEKYLLALNATSFVHLMHRAGLAQYMNQDPHEPRRHGAPSGPFTFIVPTNAMLENWMRAAAETGSHTLSLRETLLYHILPGVLPPGSLRSGMMAGTELRTSRLGGARQQLVVSVDTEALKQGVRPAEVGFGDATVLGGPYEAGGSLVYVVSDVLQVPEDPLQTAVSTLSLSTYVASVYSAGINHRTRDQPAATYVIPRNAAYDRLGLVMQYLLLPMRESRKDLTSLLQYHAIDGIVYSHKIPEDWTPYPTVHGAPLYLRRRPHDGRIEVERTPEQHTSPPSVLEADVLTDTGAIHVLNRVAYPPELNISLAKLVQGAKTNVMAELVQEAGFGWLFDEPRSSRHPAFVLLAPVDQAFQHVNLTHYRSNPDALRRLVALHILPVQRESRHRKHVRHDRMLPIAVHDEARSASLLAEYAGDARNVYSELAFRVVPQRHNVTTLGYMVGIRGSCGATGHHHAANILSYGRISHASAEAPEEGGLLTLDGVLEPYYPTWFHRCTYPPPHVTTLTCRGLVVYPLTVCMHRDRQRCRIRMRLLALEPLRAAGRCAGRRGRVDVCVVYIAYCVHRCAARAAAWAALAELKRGRGPLRDMVERQLLVRFRALVEVVAGHVAPGARALRSRLVIVRGVAAGLAHVNTYIVEACV